MNACLLLHVCMFACNFTNLLFVAFLPIQLLIDAHPIPALTEEPVQTSILTTTVHVQRGTLEKTAQTTSMNVQTILVTSTQSAPIQSAPSLVFVTLALGLQRRNYHVKVSHIVLQIPFSPRSSAPLKGMIRQTMHVSHR